MEWAIRCVGLHGLLGFAVSLAVCGVCYLILTIRLRSYSALKMADFSTIHSLREALFYSCWGLSGMFHYFADYLNWGF